METRQAIILTLMPISARLDDFLERYEYLDSRDPSVLQASLTLLSEVQNYVNDMYAGMNVTKEEWDKLSKEIIPYEKTANNNDNWTPSVGENNLGEGPPEGTPQRV